MKKIIVLFLAIFALGIVDARKINSEVLEFIKKKENFKPNFYPDMAGHRTIGYGHKCKSQNCENIKAPMKKEDAVELLLSDLLVFEKCVNDFAPYLDDYQFSALVSFTFNAGCHSLTNTKESTIGRLIKARDYPAASKEFARWNKVTRKDGTVVVAPGLVTRRRMERDFFCRIDVCLPPIRLTY